jgi:hypothetical protein
MAILLLNEYRETKQLDPVGLTVVRLTINIVRPIIRKLRKRKHDSKDASCPGARVHLGWVSQLRVRLGKHDFKHDEDCNKHLALTSTPDCFDRSKLTMLSIHQIAFWDEVHKEQVVGVTGDAKYAFPRDEDGAFDENGQVADQARKLHMKYTK